MNNSQTERLKTDKQESFSSGEKTRSEDSEFLHELAGADLGRQAVEVVVELSNPETSIENPANYQGNWTEAQTQRMSSVDFKNRFAAFITRGASEPQGSSGMFDKTIDQVDYLTRIDGYDDLFAKVTNKINYAEADKFGKHPQKLGTARYDPMGSEVAVFTDATKNGLPLTGRQKDIIAAHEMYHGLINPKGSNAAEVTSAFDFDVVADVNRQSIESGDERVPRSYMANPNELTARMAQLKNYFGMKGDEVFTTGHLEYARVNYVTDTELDNNMTLFFKMIRPERFIKLMNEIPV